MAQIDLLNILKATSTPSNKGVGLNVATNPAGAGKFEQILSGQKEEAVSATPLGNSMPAGKGLPTAGLSKLQQAQTSQQLFATIAPAQQSQIDDLSFMTHLQPLVDMPQVPKSGPLTALPQLTDTKISFSDQQLQDLAVQLGVDPAVAKLVLQSTIKPQDTGDLANAQVSSTLGMGFKPGQVQTASPILALEGASDTITTNVVLPAMAKTVLQPSASGQVQRQVQVPPQIQVQAQGQVKAQGQVQPQVQVQPQIQAQPQVQVQAQSQVQAQPQVQVQVQPQAQIQSQVQPQVQSQVEGRPQVQGQSQVQVQPQVQVQSDFAAQAKTPVVDALKALPLNDKDVIKVRNQTITATANNKVSSSNSSGVTPSFVSAAPQMATQSFFQQRQSKAVSPQTEIKTGLANTINKALTQAKGKLASTAGNSASATSSAASVTSTYASITLAPSLVQKLDQFTGLPSPVASSMNALESNTLGSYTGANFKAAAPLTSLSTMTTVAAAPAIDAPTMDIGQRFTNLMQGDSSAQMGARQMQDQIGQQLQRMVKEGRWQANLSLNPARLGQVNISLVMEDGVLKTQLLSSNPGVRELLESSLPKLRDQLADSGLQLADVSVGADSGGHQQARGEQPDWQLSQTVKNTSEEQIPMAASHRSNHDGDVDTFA
ncbi:flagellar hook-length control protein FliK [Oceanospirillaceae bacterium]|nr:flagellar hook-length control protein FliK [Oceanospirillaceae bacterium]